MMLISRDAFAERLKELIVKRVSDGRGPVGLYVERELRGMRGIPNRLFKETRTKRKRAYGVGPKPVDPVRAYDADVGSEGIVAQLVSEVCRENRRNCFNHPGPDKIREKKIRRFILVTDLIGSGKRARTYLEAAWRLRSVKSWWSARATCGMTFEVVAYAATERGRSKVGAHRSSPEIHVVSGCPTILNTFDEEMRAKIVRLCVDYNPAVGNSMSPLGFDGAGVLIAFAHGAPNNTPLMLHKRGIRNGQEWRPLFPERVTSTTRSTFSVSLDSRDSVRSRLLEFGQRRLASSGWLHSYKPSIRGVLFVMASLGSGPRTLEAISGRTHLTVMEVEDALKSALKLGWVDGRRHLTEAGHNELNAARRNAGIQDSLPIESKEAYYPKSLRGPSGSSS